MSFLCSRSVGFCEHFQGCVSKESLSSSLLHFGNWPRLSLGLFLFQNTVLTLQIYCKVCALWKHSHLHAAKLEMSWLFATQPHLPSAFKEKMTSGYPGSCCIMSCIQELWKLWEETPVRDFLRPCIKKNRVGAGRRVRGVGKCGHRPVWLLKTVIGRVLHWLRCGQIVSLRKCVLSIRAEPNSASCLPRTVLRAQTHRLEEKWWKSAECLLCVVTE